jgi:hypothetical protein
MSICSVVIGGYLLLCDYTVLERTLAASHEEEFLISLFRPEVLYMWGPPPGGPQVFCVRDIIILNEIWAQHKTYTF